MNSVRKVFWCLMAVMLTAFALPAAAQKVYLLTVSPSPLSVGASAQVTAEMSNISSDQGNSTIKSFKLIAPNGIRITSPASGSTVNLGGFTATVQLLSDGSAIYLSNIQLPLKPFGPHLFLIMNVNVSCTASGGGWTVLGPWNGAGFTGQTFVQQPPAPTTGVTGACTFSTMFLNEPGSKAFANYPITDTAFNNPTGNSIKVKLLQNNAAPPIGTSVTLTSLCTLAGKTASTDSFGIATFSALSVSGPATGCTLMASFGTSSDTSQPFDIVLPDGTLACAGGAASSNSVVPPLDPTSAVPPPSDGQTGWALVRGTNTVNDANGNNCGPEIPYTFVCYPSTSTCQFTEDSLGQHTSIEYVILWPKVDVATDPTADKQPCVAWGITDPQLDPDSTAACSGDFVPGLACTTDNVNGGNAVMPNIPDATPFNDRDGSGNYVQPLRYQPTSVTGLKAKVCVAQHGFTAGTSDANGNAVGFEVYWTKIIDQSDSTVKLP
jgi:hypothetical protein